MAWDTSYTPAITKASILSQEAAKTAIPKPFANGYTATYQGLRDGNA
jgi:hypothetical protein